VEVDLDEQRVAADKKPLSWFRSTPWAIGPVAPASPYPVRPALVSTRIRQLPAMFWIAIARMLVIFTLPWAGVLAEQPVNFLAAHALDFELQRAGDVATLRATGSPGEQSTGEGFAGAVGLDAARDGIVLADRSGGPDDGARQVLGQSRPVSVSGATFLGVVYVLDCSLRPAHTTALRLVGRESQTCCRWRAFLRRLRELMRG